MHDPYVEHWELVNRILRYLKHTVMVFTYSRLKMCLYMHIQTQIGRKPGWPSINQWILHLLWGKPYLLECKEAKDYVEVKYGSRITRYCNCNIRTDMGWIFTDRAGYFYFSTFLVVWQYGGSISNKGSSIPCSYKAYRDRFSLLFEKE